MNEDTRVRPACVCLLVQVQGRVTYNGKTFKEFLPERTAIYVEQDDVHIGEMTVRETMDFSARCQGTGSNAG